MAVVSLDQARAAREAEKIRKEQPKGTCARGMKEECGMKDPSECSVHAPYLPPDAS